ncbi:hypothetical protein AWC26_02840 [Mycobacterium shimoidei]|nr:hypothetical protein BHQ16_12340 [Mycobacterium shimoidei]ORW83358.1 hypothetical protein AWC26_02840 [Mycobacterium shimoidei]
MLFHACEMPWPIGMSNSSVQPDSGTVLEFVMVKRAMKPVCQVCSTLNVAVGAAASATGVIASPRMATSKADTAM